MSGRGLSFEDTKHVQMDTTFVDSMTVRMYCKCGNADVVTGNPLGIQDAVNEFASEHNKPECGPCDARTAARARAKKARLVAVPFGVEGGHNG